MANDVAENITYEYVTRGLKKKGFVVVKKIYLKDVMQFLSGMKIKSTSEAMLCFKKNGFASIIDFNRIPDELRVYCFIDFDVDTFVVFENLGNCYIVNASGACPEETKKLIEAGMGWGYVIIYDDDNEVSFEMKLGRVSIFKDILKMSFMYAREVTEKGLHVHDIQYILEPVMNFHVFGDDDKDDVRQKETYLLGAFKLKVR